MALKCVPIFCSQKPQSLPEIPALGYSRGRLVLDLRPIRLECCALGASAQSAICLVEDEKPGAKTSPTGKIDKDGNTISRGFHKDLNLLPKPLSKTDLSPFPDDGSNVRVAFQGISGAYGEDAALKAYPNCETVPCDQFEAAFNAVELWLVDKAVLPIENSVGGSLHRNYDLLLRHRLHIVREVLLVVNHCLLALPGVEKQEVKRVLSHPQALAQCEMALTKMGIIRVSADDSAGAAKIVASSGRRDMGAIASARAAALYGLDILAEKVQDEDDNVTRYLVLTREPIIPGTDRLYKTSIVFTLEEGPGMLFKALAVFSLRGINLSKIESRPQKGRPLRVVDDSNKGSAKYFDYLFYIDFEASMAEKRAQNALEHLQVSCLTLFYYICNMNMPDFSESSVAIRWMKFYRWITPALQGRVHFVNIFIFLSNQQDGDGSTPTGNVHTSPAEDG
ncbi:Arogenate dehydratase/prephenate dehydratase 1, chloroplastic [Gossypium arboreum]|uniref:arogenate dehydratase n=1 Tax=Gossypium arboreum TaxID=29729 RepID=A0A0B0NTK1_GOSAR|nr:Arogenate dehydratase/prephenate dehydratase 1, chloroplastic [Gossypium arboreum]